MGNWFCRYESACWLFSLASEREWKGKKASNVCQIKLFCEGNLKWIFEEDAWEAMFKIKS